jgi:hypothetical protein
MIGVGSVISSGLSAAMQDTSITDQRLLISPRGAPSQALYPIGGTG